MAMYPDDTNPVRGLLSRYSQSLRSPVLQDYVGKRPAPETLQERQAILEFPPGQAPPRPPMQNQELPASMRFSSDSAQSTPSLQQSVGATLSRITPGQFHGGPAPATGPLPAQDAISAEPYRNMPPERTQMPGELRLGIGQGPGSPWGGGGPLPGSSAIYGGGGFRRLDSMIPQRTAMGVPPAGRMGDRGGRPPDARRMLLQKALRGLAFPR